jgi:hypothetical protein
LVDLTVKTPSYPENTKVYISKEWMQPSDAKEPRVYCIGDFGLVFDPLANEPLSSRAWTLQERLLSPRILHFGTEQMYWECGECFLGEDGSRSRDVFHSVRSVVYGQLLPYSESGLPKGSGMSLTAGEDIPNPRVGRWAGGWLSLVEEYSKRKLTKEKDKLPALAGLARLIAKLTNDDYYAGLWKNHIIEDLYWRVYAREEMKSLEEDTGKSKPKYGRVISDVRRPAIYRAPSWSWASVDANILYLPMDFDYIVAKFIECNIKPALKDPYGMVESGWIKICVGWPLYQHLVGLY